MVAQGMVGQGDVIEKQVLLKATRARVWRALTDHREFGQWFGVVLDGPFVVGQAVRGLFEGNGPTSADMEPHFRAQGLPPVPIAPPPPDAVFCTVEQMEPERVFAFRWIPFGIDASIDWAREEPTRVEFVLEERPGGTLLTLRESGFDRVPAHRRALAFRMNAGGWAVQTENLARHVQST